MSQDRIVGLVQGCRSGNSWSEAALWEAVGERLMATICKSFPGIQDADVQSIASEAFADALRQIDSYRGEATFTSWLVSIARNIALKHLGRLKTLEQETSLDAIPEAAFRPRRREESPRWSREDLLAVLRDAWLLMTIEQLHVALLRLLHGLSPSEVSERLDKTLRSVGSLFRKASLVLRQVHQDRSRGLDPLRELCG